MIIYDFSLNIRFIFIRYHLVSFNRDFDQDTISVSTEYVFLFLTQPNQTKRVPFDDLTTSHFSVCSHEAYNNVTMRRLRKSTRDSCVLRNTAMAFYNVLGGDVRAALHGARLRISSISRDKIIFVRSAL